MTGNRIYQLIRYLRRTAAPVDSPIDSDAQLLRRFAEARDEAAFELLARRHGSMVLGVCRRVLGDVHEAEDALQATFLVLARKAATVARYRSVGGWLHTVAQRVALRARARRATRTAHEQLQEKPAASPDPAAEVAWAEVRRVIDEEVSRLPEKYRVPFVLFHLEGRSNAEVAQEFGCAVGTVESWLTRARERLRVSLTRRGLAPASGLLAALAAPESWLPQATAAARAVLATIQGTAGTVSAEANALAGEIVRSLAVAKAAKIAITLLLLVSVIATTAVGLAGWIGSPQEPPVVPSPSVPVPRVEKPQAVRVVAAVPVKLGTFPGHTDGTNCLTFSPDGKTLASAGNDTLVTLWDMANPKGRNAIRQTIPPLPVNCVAFSPDGSILAAGNNTRTIKLWELGTRKETMTLEDSVFVYTVMFSPDGKKLVSSGGIQPAALKTVKNFNEIKEEWFKEIGLVKVWDLATRQPRILYEGNTGRVSSVAFSPDGKLLAGGVRDGAVRLWDVASGKELACFRETSQHVSSVAFSPDGTTLAAAHYGPDDQVILWDVASRRLRTRLKGQAGAVTALAFSPDGTLATASTVSSTDPKKPREATGEIRRWDVAARKQLGVPLTFPHTSCSVTFNKRGSRLAVGGVSYTGREQITLWNLVP
jgi:RNA polymerase sigma factor (sigma-70 family)